MIKLTVLVKRNPALSVEDFHERWRAHGRMIADEPAFRPYIRRYEQNHRVPADYRNGDTYDGMAMQWFDSYHDFIAMLQDPAYAEKMQPDESRILDMDKIVVIFTEEAEVFIAENLHGKVALVTGGASGIGAATAKQLEDAGAVVVVADLGGRHPVDVTDEGAVDALVRRIIDEHGRLDIAANVAGTSGTYANVADATTESWRRTMQVNLDAVFFCLRAELLAMRTAGNGGSVVNVASSAGKMGVPGLSAYSASKHGVIGLTKSAALEVARDGIRVNAVCPGTIRTPMLRGFVGGDEDMLEKMGRRAPIGRIGEPEEIAEAIVWLCTDAASFVTGHALEADGGVAAV